MIRHVPPMLSRVAVGLICCGWTATAAAQSSSPPTFNLDLTTPDVPAFTILGVSPTQIERPATPKAFAVSLLSSTTDSSNLIPSKYALVAAPYWMRQESVTIDEYLQPGVAQSLAQTFTVSVATNPVSSNTDIGFGLAASPWAGHGSQKLVDGLVDLGVALARSFAAGGTVGLGGFLERLSKATSPDAFSDTPEFTDIREYMNRPNPESLKRIVNRRYQDLATAWQVEESLKKVIDKNTDAFQERRGQKIVADQKILDAAIDALFAADPLPLLAGPVGELLRHQPEVASDTTNLAEARRIVALRVVAQLIPAVATLRAQADKSVDSALNNVTTEDKLRVGWMLGLSGAVASRVPNNALTSGHQLRSAFWALPAYRDENTHLELIGVLKWIQRDASEGPDLFDIGARVVKQAGKAAFSGEFLGRTERSSAGSNPATERLTFNFDYQIADKVFVTGAFGKDFANPSAGQSKGGLLSVLGVTLGLSKSPSVSTPTS